MKLMDFLFLSWSEMDILSYTRLTMGGAWEPKRRLTILGTDIMGLGNQDLDIGLIPLLCWGIDSG